MEGIGQFFFSHTLQLFSASIREQLEQWLGSSDELSIFISGRTGGGKSSLVNAFLGAKLAEEGAEPDPTTATVASYERVVSGVRVRVWDSPGLQDGTQNEERYLNDIAARCAGADLFLFCINVGDAVRFNLDSPEVKALAKLTGKLSPAIWNHAIIALTFANRLGRTSMEMKRAKMRNKHEKVKELFCEKVREWEDLLRDTVLPHAGLSSDQIEKLKIVPTGHPRGDPSLPDRPHWLSTFWFEALRSTHPRAQPALLRMNETRLVENPDMVDEKTQTQHSEDQAFIFSEFGGSVGKLICGSENLGSIAGIELAEMKELNLKERIVLEQFFIMKTIEERPLESSSPPPPPQLEEDMMGAALNGSLPQLELEDPPSTSSPLSVHTSNTSGCGGAVDGGAMEGGLQRGERESLSSLASPKSECGGHPYQE